MLTKINIADLTRLLLDRQTSDREIVAIAGPPGSGKSTIAEKLVSALNSADPGYAALLPMDGYHLDDRILGPLGLQSRKGAPETFDVAGLKHMLTRLCANQEPKIAVPIFDREIEIARAGAGFIHQGCKIIVVEGNYLLLNQPPWNELAVHFNTKIMLQLPEVTLRERLTERWKHYGLDAADVSAKINENDIPNGKLVIENSAVPDFLMEN